MKNFMKKALIFSLMLTVALGSFVSCSDDDDDKKTSLAAKVAGNYTGRLVTMELNGNYDVKVEAVSDNEVKITFATATSIAPFNVKLVDTGVQGIIQSSINPTCQFLTLVDGIKIVDTEELITFEGKRK